MQQSTYVVFAVGGLPGALARPEVRVILPLPALERPPALPSAIEGILNLAGTAVPVLRLDRLFGLPPVPLTAYRHLIMLAHVEPPLALLVDRVSEVVRVPPARLAPADETTTFNGCITAHLMLDNAPVPVLSTERLLAVRERQALEDFQAAAQQRLDQLKVPP